MRFEGAGLDGSVADVVCRRGAFSTSVTLSSGDGNKVVTVAQSDSAGNRGSEEITFVLDQTGPALEVTTPDSGSRVVNALAQTLEGTCEEGTGNSSVSFSGSGLDGTVTPVACSGGGTFRSAIALSSGDGRPRR